MRGGEHVLNGAEVELTLVGPVLRDDGEPQFVGVIGGEVALAQVIVDWWMWSFPVLAALLSEHGEPLIVPADPPRSPPEHWFSHLHGFFDEEPVAELAELRIIEVGVQQGVGMIGLAEFGPGDLLFPPAVVGAAGRAPRPAGTPRRGCRQRRARSRAGRRFACE